MAEYTNHRVIVSTCGTSLITNNVSKELRELLLKTANLSEKEIASNPQEKETIDAHLQKRQNELMDIRDWAQQRKASAELNGILCLYQPDKPLAEQGRQDQHILLCSDTFHGEKIGNILLNWLRDKRLVADVKIIKDLSTGSPDLASVAMDELVKWAEEGLGSYKTVTSQVIFNLTGGYKLLQGFMTVLGMLYADELVYVFESESSQLLTIPRLPITIDYEAIKDILHLFRIMANGKDLNQNEIKGIKECYFINMDGKVNLSWFGWIVWNRSKEKYYKERLLDPPSPVVVFSEPFRKSASDLPKGKLAGLNARIDDLCVYLDSSSKINRSGLDFKPLKGHPVQGSTHEFDIWSGEEYRGFGHFGENKEFIIDKLERGLH